MLKIILIVVAVVLVGFCAFVATRPSHFSYSENAIIKASAEKIYPYISQLKLCGQWSPYEKRDPSMKKTFTEADGVPGAKLDFDGSKESGAGSVEIMSLVPNREVNVKLTMTRPMNMENKVVYKLEPVGSDTRFTWSMEGENGFIGKLFTVLLDCKAMMTKDMNEGFQNLRALVEK